MDLFSRKPIGWALSFSPNSQLTGDALKMALNTSAKHLKIGQTSNK
jgi:putative transposase